MNKEFVVVEKIAACGITLDLSKQRISREEFDSLVRIAREKRLLERESEMMNGAYVNPSERRQALHTSLRRFGSDFPYAREVVEERRRMFAFASAVGSGSWRGCRGDKILTVVNIGIGGSEMGPKALYHALRSSRQTPKVHFLAAVDGVLLDRILSECDPYSTLVIVSSKSFRTRETQVNASAVDQWLLNAGIVGADRERHMVVVSANPDAGREMCLPEENQFYIWDWVGGRFSVWGSIGLPAAIALGVEKFQEFLHGANEMDEHAVNAPIERNAPALLALLSYWNARARGIVSHCMLPYDERLRVLVPWLQQLEMESLGKSVPEDPDAFTGMQVWGAHGNEAQHSFYQWLREGTSKTSIDVLWSEMPGAGYAEHYKVLRANARAQVEALAVREDSGRFFNAVTAVGIDNLTPRRLGALMAMYEHKTTMLGTLFGINPFDQPGVEYGKKLSRELELGGGVG